MVENLVVLHITTAMMIVWLSPKPSHSLDVTCYENEKYSQKNVPNIETLLIFAK